MAPKPKVEIAREHLTKAQNEWAAGDGAGVVVWSFASLEAAIDALAEPRGFAIARQHFRRRETARKLFDADVLATDLSDLHSALNEARKASVYDGEEPDVEGWTLEDVLIAVESAVDTAEADSE